MKVIGKMIENGKCEFFHQMMEEVNPHYAFSFDNQNLSQSIPELLHSYESDLKLAPQNTDVIPIIHGYREALHTLCKKFLKHSKANIIAVAERELGTSISQRILTIQKIKKEINQIDENIQLHLLGTGNPISIAVYSFAGADSFDGLEWYEKVVNYKDSTLHPFSHADFFKNQSKWFNDNDDLDFHESTLFHNLDFYYQWMIDLQNALNENNFMDFLKKKIPEQTFKILNENLK